MYVTTGKFSELSGYTVRAIREKIKSGHWQQGKIWVKAPDRRVLINTEEFEKWAISQDPALELEAQRQ